MLPAACLVAGALILGSCAPALPLIGGDPAESAAGGTTQPYRAAFANHVAFQPAEPRAWRETNDRVRALNGPDAQMQAESEDDPMPAARR